MQSMSPNFKHLKRREERVGVVVESMSDDHEMRKVYVLSSSESLMDDIQAFWNRANNRVACKANACVSCSGSASPSLPRAQAAA